MNLIVSGNLGPLKAWSDKIKNLKAVKRDVLANIGEELVELIREGFDKESDPFGSAWAPLKQRVGRILQDTGALRNSFHRQSISDDSVTVGSSVGYGGYHQSGTSRMVARKMVPDTGSLPDAWKSRIDAIAAKALKQALGA